MNLRYLSRSDVEDLDISMSQIISVVEEGFRLKGLGKVQMPPKIAVKPRGPESFLHAMPAYVGGLDIAAIKWVGGNDDNPGRGLPTISGLIVLNDPETMFPVCVMDAIWVTAVRTGAANAVAMKYLGPAQAETVSIVGCGVQGRSNLLAMATIYPEITGARCFDVNPDALERFIRESLDAYDFRITPAASPREAVEGADVVVTAGPSPKDPTPYLSEKWLKRGAMAAPVDYMGAWEGPMASSVDRLITDDHGQMEYYRSKGYFRDVPRPYADLGEIVAGIKPGRQSPDERTMSILLGIALDDAVTANLIHQRAIEEDIGTLLPL